MTEAIDPKRYRRHPLPIAAFNVLGPVLLKAGLLPGLDVETLLAKARKKTGLKDFGNERFLKPLEVLVTSINEEANLSALGLTITHKRLLDALTTRLRTEDLLKRHPEILEIELAPPIVIAGLQRTGTTLLHRLIASHTGIRAPLSWEVLSPLPREEEIKTFERTGIWPEAKAREKEARLAEKGLRYIAPAFFAIHPVEYDMPEEDILLLDLSFMSQTPEATMAVPRYAHWLETVDATPAYEEMKRYLQILMWGRGEARLVLKSPHHMEHIDTILKVFPGATIIQTHRDPAKTLPSFLSMVAHGTGVFSDVVDTRRIAAHWQKKVIRLIDRADAARRAHPDATICDVSYADLVRAPITTLETIYEKIGLPFTEPDREAAEAVLSRQKKDKYGRHLYDPADFGLSSALIRDRFADYVSARNIPPE